MPNKQKPTGSKPGRGKKNQPERSQTLIIPQISPEVLEMARRAAAEGKTPQQIEEQAAEAAAKAAEAKAEAAAAEAAAAEAAARAAQRSARPTRAEAEAELAQNVHDDHLWLNNPVMMRGLGLAPVVAMASDVDRSLMLCALAILLLTATRVLAVAVCHLTGNRFRAVVYAYSAAIVYIPAYIILYEIFGANLSVLGIYLPMMVVEPVIIKRLESPDLETIGEALRRGINNTVGLCVVVMLVGALRELLAYGTLLDQPVLTVAPLPLASEPAGGFLLLGILAAGWAAVTNAYVHYKEEEVRHLYANRKY